MKPSQGFPQRPNHRNVEPGVGEGAPRPYTRRPARAGFSLSVADQAAVNNLG
jgi:hypothetical protein